MDDLKAAIAEKLGITALAADEQQDIIEKFGEVALKASTAAVLEKLSPEQREEFLKLAQTNDALKVKTFLQSALPDHEAIAHMAVEEEVRKLRAFLAVA